MASDSKCEEVDVSTKAYISYVKEKGFAPKNASHLLNYCRLNKPVFTGINYKTAAKIVAHPPNIAIDELIKNNNDNDAKKPIINPYIDTSLTSKFPTVSDNKLFIEKHQQTPPQSNVTRAYDLYKEKKGAHPTNPMLFRSFCESTKLNITYSECSQYISSQNKSKKHSTNIKSLKELFVKDINDKKKSQIFTNKTAQKENNSSTITLPFKPILKCINLEQEEGLPGLNKVSISFNNQFKNSEINSYFQIKIVLQYYFKLSFVQKSAKYINDEKQSSKH
eukprot:16210_1